MIKKILFITIEVLIMIGKKIRLERIINRNTGRTVIAPMDHGVSSGPIPGIIDMDETVEEISQGGADAILMHKGIVKQGHIIVPGAGECRRDGAQHCAF